MTGQRPPVAFDPLQLKERRVAAGLNRPQLGKRADVGWRAIRNYEYDVSDPSARALGRLAGALDCSVGDFFTELAATQRRPSRARSAA